MVQSMHWHSTSRRCRDVVDDSNSSGGGVGRGDLLSPLDPPSSHRWAFGSNRSHMSSLYGAGCFPIGET